MLTGRIREIKQDIERLELGVYLTIWVPTPHGTFTKGETEEQVKKKIQEFKTIHPGEIEFQYKDKSNE